MDYDPSAAVVRDKPPWYEKAAIQGNADDQTSPGNLYLTAWGPRRLSEVVVHVS